jgi:transposase
MRQVTRYTAKFKENILAKALASNAPSPVKLAQEANIPYGTLHTWIKMSKKKSNVNKEKAPPPPPSSRPVDQSAQAQLRAVLDTMDKTASERAAYCRQHGFYIHQLEEWKEQILNGLGKAPSKKAKAEHQQLMLENKRLQRDLKRKDKALAEVSALLILKKKADLIWGEEEED